MVDSYSLCRHSRQLLQIWIKLRGPTLSGKSNWPLGQWLLWERVGTLNELKLGSNVPASMVEAYKSK
jgi:hypothetical protein